MLGLLAITITSITLPVILPMAAFNEKKKINNKTHSFWVVDNNQSTMLAKSCLSNLFVIYTIHQTEVFNDNYSCVPSWANAGNSVGSALPSFPEGTENVPQPSVWCPPSTASVRLSIQWASNGPSEKTFPRYVFSCNPSLLEYMHACFWITGTKEEKMKVSPPF